MRKVLELGEFYVSNFIKPGEDPGKKYSLDLYRDEDGAICLGEQPPQDELWGKYWYHSGMNNSMKEQLKDVVYEIIRRRNYNLCDIWLDIACNDGTLLSYVPDNFIKLGIDPAEDKFYNKSSKHGKIYQGFFSKENYYKLTDDTFGEPRKAKVITCIAMFYDLKNPDQFIKDVYDCLDDDGIFVVQMSYTPLMMKQLAFDNICHEHYYYYDYKTLIEKFYRNDFIPRDVTLNSANGGSFRVTFSKKGVGYDYVSAPERDVAVYRKLSIISAEAEHYSIHTWNYFGNQIYKLKNQIKALINIIKNDKKIIWGYGASTKGSTMLQYFELTDKDIGAIVEKNQDKVGLVVAGTNIPIVSEQEFRRYIPDYILVLPWHFIDEFVEREREYLENGGMMIVPCPYLRIIDKDGERPID